VGIADGDLLDLHRVELVVVNVNRCALLDGVARRRARPLDPVGGLRHHLGHDIAGENAKTMVALAVSFETR